jgi:hypothetical protein
MGRRWETAIIQDIATPLLRLPAGPGASEEGDDS